MAANDWSRDLLVASNGVFTSDVFDCARQGIDNRSKRVLPSGRCCMRFWMTARSPKMKCDEATEEDQPQAVGFRFGNERRLLMIGFRVETGHHDELLIEFRFQLYSKCLGIGSKPGFDRWRNGRELIPVVGCCMIEANQRENQHGKCLDKLHRFTNKYREWDC